MNVAAIIEGHDANARALIDGDVEITYGELRDRVADLRTILADRGVGPDDVVAIAAGNEPHFAVAALATMGVGAIAMPMNPHSPTAEMARRLAPVAPKLLLVGEAGSALLDAADGLPTDVVDLATVAVPPSAADPGIAERKPGDRAFYMGTSGVSGEPKVVILSHRNIGWMQEALDQISEPLTADDVLLGCLPLAHIFGLNVVLLTSLRVGACVVLQRKFDAADGIELIRRHRITIVNGAPPMWQLWASADAPDDSLASVRAAGSGAASLPIGVFDAVRDRFGIEIAQGYGLTETSPVVTLGRGHPIRPASVGKVLPGVDVALVSDDGTPVDLGDEGQVVVRSPGVFAGYLDDPQMTSAVLTDDGWFWTGDVGIFDDDGYLYLVDRIKDVVIVSGFNVYPGEVETVLMDHPSVSGAIVTGSPHIVTGEQVVAHVSGTATEDELRAHAARHLSRYKCPAEYHFVNELPIAANGKPIRRALR